MSNKMTLYLNETLIKQAKTKAFNEDKSVSEFCRAILDAWNKALFGYESYQSKNKLPHFSGVYIVLKNDAVTYVGQSVNLRQRFYKHHRDSEFENSLIYWFYIQKDLLLDVEKFCIDTLEPELNTRDTVPESELRKNNYIRIAFPTPQTEMEKQAMEWLSGEKFMQRADERMAKVVLAYQLWLAERQQANLQAFHNVAGE